MLIMHGFDVDAGEDEDVKMMAGPNVAEQDIGATVVHCGPATLRGHCCLVSVVHNVAHNVVSAH